MKNRSQNPQLFVAIFSIVGLIIFCWGVNSLIESQGSKSWPTTEGKILSSSVQQSGRNKSKLLYSAAVRYRFEVDGKSYESNRVAFGSYDSSTSSNAASIVARYSAGTAATVHYSPKNPASSVLEAGSSLMDFLMPLVGLFFVGGGVALFILKPGMRKLPS